jgi:hypothetical protein
LLKQDEGAARKTVEAGFARAGREECEEGEQECGRSHASVVAPV